MPKEIYNILIISGMLNSEHDPRINEWLRTMLESCGRFKVKINEEFAGATPAMLEKYDAVLINYHGRNQITDPDYTGFGETAEKTLCDFVRSGKGAIFYHSTVTAGGSPEELRKMIGYEFDAIWRKDLDRSVPVSRKSPKLDMVVKFDDDHEISKDLMPRSWSTPCDDLFVGARRRADSNIRVVATVFDALEDYDPGKMQKHVLETYKGVDFTAMPGVNTDAPVAWTNTYGEGRVFCVPIGHGPDTIRRPPFVSMMCRGAEWVCSGEVTIEAPDLQFENRFRAWPYYLNVNHHENARLMEF